MGRYFEAFDEFNHRQGCRYVIDNLGISPRTGLAVQMILFENGACSDTENHFDPPKDPNMLVRAKLNFCKVALELEEEQFSAFRSACLEQCALATRYPDSCPTPPPSAQFQLAAGAARVLSLRKSIADYEHILDPNKKAREEAAAERERQRALAYQQFHNSIVSITI